MEFIGFVICALAVLQEITAQPIELTNESVLSGSRLNLGLSSSLGLSNNNNLLGSSLSSNSNLLGSSLSSYSNLLGGVSSNRRTASYADPNLSSGGAFQVISTSPIGPTGVSVLAENLAIEGPLTVGGSLPLLATVGLDGQLPTAGQASTQYSCGNGKVGITSEVGPRGAVVTSNVGLPNGACIGTRVGAGAGGVGVSVRI